MRRCRVIRIPSLVACVFAVVAAAGRPQSAPPGRPWDVKGTLTSEFRDRSKAAGKDPVKLKELASWCVEQGAPHLVARTYESTPLAADHASLLGHLPDANPPALVDAARYGASSRSLPNLVPLDPKRKKELLAAKDKPIKLVNQSTYFDLNSDLDSAELDLHSKMLNDYYRAMKNRFRAVPDTNVDVFIYANRSDYLLDYAVLTQKTGEHILGYFIPAWRSLYFYDDPYDRDEVALIARHECTHLLFDIAYDDRSIPDWLNEGMACYLAGDGEHARGGYTMRLVLELAAQLERPKFELSPVFAVTHEKLTYEHYAQSWAMIMFLNGPGRSEKFQKFLLTLRETLDPEAKEAKVLTSVREQLEIAFNESVESLAEGGQRYVKETMSFQRPDQLLELALSAIDRAQFDKPGLPVERLVETAATGLRESTPALKGPELARAKLGALRLKLLRADLDKPKADGWRIALRSITDDLKDLPPLVDESQIGEVARAVIARAAVALDLKGQKGIARDLVAELREVASKTQGLEAEKYKAFTVIVEDVLEIAYSRLGKALESDPLHRRAGRQWVQLSMEAAPHKLLEIYPLLKLLVERDASDEALATLGVAYIGLGNARFGKSLLTRASEFTAQPNLIAELLAWKD